jgi:hypothetical protein
MYTDRIVVKRKMEFHFPFIIHFQLNKLYLSSKRVCHIRLIIHHVKNKIQMDILNMSILGNWGWLTNSNSYSQGMKNKKALVYIRREWWSSTLSVFKFVYLQICRTSTLSIALDFTFRISDYEITMKESHCLNRPQISQKERTFPF